MNSSSTPTGERTSTSRRAAAMTVATAALLSAPRMPALRLEKASCSRTTSTGASSGTVSMCAQSRIVRAPSGPGMRASRLPASEPVSAPLPSSSTWSPSARRSAVSASAIARSERDGLSSSQSRTKSPSRRVRSTGAATMPREDTLRRLSVAAAAHGRTCQSGEETSR